MAIFTFFLIIVTILWYLNKLNNEHTDEITFPVKYSGMPRGLVMVGEVPNSINLRVTSNGYTLLRYGASSRITPINIDLSSLTPAASNLAYSERYFLVTSRLRGSISNRFRDDLKLEGISPDTLHFEFAPIAERRIPVVPNLSIGFERQYMQSGPLVLTPDSITISGPKSIVDTINAIRTLPVKADRLKQTLSRNIALKPVKQVGLSHRRVHVELPVGMFTQASISLPVSVKNLPDSLKLILLPQWITLKCNVPVSRYSSISSKSFQASVDFNAIDKSRGGRAMVRISKKPLYIQNISFEPQYLDYIIERR